MHVSGDGSRALDSRVGLVSRGLDASLAVQLRSATHEFIQRRFAEMNRSLEEHVFELLEFNDEENAHLEFMQAMQVLRAEGATITRQVCDALTPGFNGAPLPRLAALLGPAEAQTAIAVEAYATEIENRVWKSSPFQFENLRALMRALATVGCAVAEDAASPARLVLALAEALRSIDHLGSPAGRSIFALYDKVVLSWYGDLTQRLSALLAEAGIEPARARTTPQEATSSASDPALRDAPEQLFQLSPFECARLCSEIAVSQFADEQPEFDFANFVEDRLRPSLDFGNGSNLHERLATLAASLDISVTVDSPQYRRLQDQRLVKITAAVVTRIFGDLRLLPPPARDLLVNGVTPVLNHLLRHEAYGQPLWREAMDLLSELVVAPPRGLRLLQRPNVPKLRSRLNAWLKKSGVSPQAADHFALKVELPISATTPKTAEFAFGAAVTTTVAAVFCDSAWLIASVSDREALQLWRVRSLSVGGEVIELEDFAGTQRRVANAHRMLSLLKSGGARILPAHPALPQLIQDCPNPLR